MNRKKQTCPVCGTEMKAFIWKDGEKRHYCCVCNKYRKSKNIKVGRDVF